MPLIFQASGLKNAAYITTSKNHVNIFLSNIIGLLEQSWENLKARNWYFQKIKFRVKIRNKGCTWCLYVVHPLWYSTIQMLKMYYTKQMILEINCLWRSFKPFEMILSEVLYHRIGTTCYEPAKLLCMVRFSIKWASG